MCSSFTGFSLTLLKPNPTAVRNLSFQRCKEGNPSGSSGNSSAPAGQQTPGIRLPSSRCKVCLLLARGRAALSVSPLDTTTPSITLILSPPPRIPAAATTPSSLYGASSSPWEEARQWSELVS